MPVNIPKKAPAFPPLQQFMPIAAPPKAKKPSGELCVVCERTHNNAGAFLCLCCGHIICSRNSLDLHRFDRVGEVINQHERTDWGGRGVVCGPAVRIIPNRRTHAPLRKYR